MADNWQTPDEVLDAARKLFGGEIELDAASSEKANERIKAKRIFTIETNALLQRWDAASVWLNPPYSRGSMGPFTDWFLRQRIYFVQGLMLVNVDTSTVWFQKLQATFDHVYFRERLAFIDPDTGLKVDNNRYQQAIFYSGNRFQHFREIFQCFGHYFKPAGQQ